MVQELANVLDTINKDLQFLQSRIWLQFHYHLLLCVIPCRDNQVQQCILRETSVSCAKRERSDYSVMEGQGIN